MSQVQISKRHRPARVWPEPLPPGARDPDIVRAKQLARPGHPIPDAVRATLTLVSHAGTWKLAVIHMSFIAGTRGAPPIPAARNRPDERSVA